MSETTWICKVSWKPDAGPVVSSWVKYSPVSNTLHLADGSILSDPEWISRADATGHVQWASPATREWYYSNRVRLAEWSSKPTNPVTSARADAPSKKTRNPALVAFGVVSGLLIMVTVAVVVVVLLTSLGGSSSVAPGQAPEVQAPASGGLPSATEASEPRPILVPPSEPVEVAPIAQKCLACDGSGRDVCYDCQGLGSNPCIICDGVGFDTCYECQGLGRTTCIICSGTGYGYGGYECVLCSGMGERSCGTCGGRGVLSCVSCRGLGTTSCYVCGGLGTRACSVCQGTGER